MEESASRKVAPIIPSGVIEFHSIHLSCGMYEIERVWCIGARLAVDQQDEVQFLVRA